MFPRLSLVALFSLVTVAVAFPSESHGLHGIHRRATGRKCGSNPSLDAVIKKESDFASVLEQNSGKDFPSGTNSIVPVRFNVIYSTEDLSGGYVPDEQIEEQIAVLNQDYSGTGLSFSLEEIDRIENADWFDNVGPDNGQQTEMKEALRRGGPGTLNVYTVSFNNDDARGLLGYATFPVDYQDNPKDDGVVLLYSSLPGGTTAPYNLGRTLTHEAGHWVGLYHPFQGGCDGPNDYVDDTPAEADPAQGCPAQRDSCPDLPGDDPVNNYMDYADDECMTEFTSGQTTRFKSQLGAYRQIYL